MEPERLWRKGFVKEMSFKSAVKATCTTWMKTIQQDLRSNNLYLDEAITVAQNRPLWRVLSAFGITHP